MPAWNSTLDAVSSMKAASSEAWAGASSCSRMTFSKARSPIRSTDRPCTTMTPSAPSRTLPPAEGEALRPLLRHLTQPDELQDLADPPPGQVVGLGEAEQMIVGTAAAVHSLGVQERTHLMHGMSELPECLAVHGDRAHRRVVKPEDEPHRRGLARPVRAEKSGDLPGLHAEREMVDRHLLAITLGEAPRLDHVYSLPPARTPCPSAMAASLAGERAPPRRPQC